MKLRWNLLLVGLIAILFLIVPQKQGVAQEELAAISFPGNNEVIRGVVSIRGSAVHSQFDRFQVAYALEPVTSNNEWITIGIERTDQVVNGELAIWDTSTVPDGSYSLRLRVIRLDGNYNEIEVKQVVVANTQPTPTPTVDPTEESATNATPTSSTPTITPTAIEPTPTIVIEVELEDTPTPRPLTTTLTLPTPRPTNEGIIPIPRVEVDTSPLKSSCLWGGAGMFAIFLFFGFLSALRMFIIGFAQRIRRR